MPKSTPDKLAEALRANLRRRKSGAVPQPQPAPQLSPEPAPKKPPKGQG